MDNVPQKTTKRSLLSRLLTRRSLRIFCWLALATMVVIIFFQNWGTVTTPILFMTVTMPRSMFIFLLIGLGFFLGILTAAPWRRARRKEGD